MHLSVDNTICLFFYAILDNSDALAVFIIVFVAAYAFEYARDKILHAFQLVVYYGTLGYVDLYSLDRKFNSCLCKASFRVVTILVYLLY